MMGLEFHKDPRNRKRDTVEKDLFSSSKVLFIIDWSQPKFYSCSTCAVNNMRGVSERFMK